MAILDLLVTTAAGALFATAGVMVGGVVTRKARIVSGCGTNNSLPTTSS